MRNPITFYCFILQYFKGLNVTKWSCPMHPSMCGKRELNECKLSIMVCLHLKTRQILYIAHLCMRGFHAMAYISYIDSPVVLTLVLWCLIVPTDNAMAHWSKVVNVYRKRKALTETADVWLQCHDRLAN